MRKNKAFTLVELLVVIGIIALLISILLPALSKAKKSANSAKCLSDLRQVVTGFQFYAADYRGAIPVTKQEYPDLGGTTAASFPGTTDTLYWQQQVGQYIAKAKLADKVDFSEAQNTVLWGCVEWDGRRSTSAGGSVGGVSIYDNGYGMNALLGTTADFPAPGVSWSHSNSAMRSVANNVIGKYYRFGSITNPAERVLVADGQLWVLYSRTINTGGINTHPGGYVDPNQVYALFTALEGITDFDFYRHASKRPTGKVQRNGFDFWEKTGQVAANAAFCDGHAETLTSFEQAYRGVFIRGPN
jgi:prepilin-type N-terminal cleavage/methylation domain-containing protein/prepilin-type processing-associated H-X9-DG protein